MEGRGSNSHPPLTRAGRLSILGILALVIVLAAPAGASTMHLHDAGARERAPWLHGESNGYLYSWTVRKPDGTVRVIRFLGPPPKRKESSWSSVAYRLDSTWRRLRQPFRTTPGIR